MQKSTQILNLLIVLFFSCSFLFSVEKKTDNPAYFKLIDTLEANYFSFDTLKQEKILSNIIDFSLDNNYQDGTIEYLLGFQYHLLGKIYYNPNPTKAEKYFEYSISSLEKAIEKKHDPEYLALLSSALGKKASFTTFSAIYWGYRSRNRLYEAYELDKNDRKILLIAAIHLMHLPESYGGDKKRAEKLLYKCLELKTEPVESKIYWASDAEVYAYLAQLEILRKNKKKAENFIQKALKFKKNYDFVRIDLKQQLERL